jgi:hypothetical protein
LEVTEQDDRVHFGMANAADKAEAETREPFACSARATQVFTHDGRTTYVENGSLSSEE